MLQEPVQREEQGRKTQERKSYDSTITPLFSACAVVLVAVIYRNCMIISYCHTCEHDFTMMDKPGDRGQQTGRCSDCGCIFSLPQPDADPDSASAVHKVDGPSKCPSCQTGRGQRRAHRRTRLDLDTHSCTMCSKTFISSAHLTLHLASHNKERKFRCNLCGKLFHQAAHLLAHKITHSGDRPFKCPECGKTFGRVSNLNTHRRLHTGEKPFKCTDCGKLFTQKAGLMAHVGSIHSRSREQPFKCEQCGEGFRSASLLLSHKAQKSKPGSAPALALDQPQKAECSTEDLKCGVCCRSFIRSSYIRLHIRLDKGQRPYHCKVCNKTFVKLDTFVSHCDKHLRQKRDKNKAKHRVVKPPLFVPLSRLPSAESSSTQPLSSEVNTRSRARKKSK